MAISPSQFLALILQRANRKIPLCNIEIRQLLNTAVLLIRQLRHETGIPFAQTELATLLKYERMSATIEFWPYHELKAAMLEAAEAMRVLSTIIDQHKQRAHVSDRNIFPYRIDNNEEY